jgi:SAM-dependent methyltransferase
MTDRAEFDSYAEDYDEALARGISVSGESKDYFAHGRISWLTRYVVERGIRAGTVMDFGCGTGSATPHFFEVLKAERLIGLDTSGKSLDVARREHSHGSAQFFSFDDFIPSAEVDLAYCNGVFHHVPPDERAASLDYIYRSLRPGALFSFWENNPWNPGTRYVMSRCPFDRDAVTITAPEARRLLKAAGFRVLSTNFLFIFPRILKPLRTLEGPLSRLPLGAQYQVLCSRD